MRSVRSGNLSNDRTMADQDRRSIPCGIDGPNHKFPDAHEVTPTNGTDVSSEFESGNP